MKLDEFDRSFGDTPRVFTSRIDDTLLKLKEDVPMKRFTIRTAILVALILLLLCGIAYAIVVFQGQEWYYNNRFSAYQEHEPIKHQAIMENLQTDVPQEKSQDTEGLVTMTMQDYSWVKGELFTLSMAARPNDPKEYELHPMMALDTDGLYGGAEPDPDDPESRTEHWLWTEKGFGLPENVMIDSSKKLLLLDFDTSGVLIGDTDVQLPMSSSDTFVGEDGASIGVLMIDLRWLDDEYIRSQYQPQATQNADTPGTYEALRPSVDGYDEGEQPDETFPEETMQAVARLQNRLSELGYYNGHINGVYDKEVQQCVAAFQKKNGLPPDGIAGLLTQQTLYGDGTMDVYGDVAVMPTPPSPEQAAQDQAEMDEMCQWALDSAGVCREAIAQSTDENGKLTLRLLYSVVPFEGGKLGDGTQGSAVFQVQVK